MAEETTSVEEHLQNYIEKIAKEQNFKSYDIKITPVSSHGANYTSTLYKIKITGDDRELNLFAKIAALTSKLREQSQFNPFHTETLFYTDLVKMYKRLEDRFGLTEAERLRVPKYYGTETTHLREILLMEDLTSRGFSSASRFESVDWSYAAASMTELAKFHALSIALQHYSPSEFEKFIALVPIDVMNGDVFEPLITGGLASAVAAVRDENKDKLKDYFNKRNVTELFMDFYKSVNCMVLTHTDYRPSNMLHKVLSDGSTEVVPVDYQTVLPGSPIIDLLYFIITATDGPFRAKNYQKTIDLYYSELGVALARFGINLEHKFPRNKFEAELKEKMPFALIMSVALLPVIVVPEDKAPVIDDMTSFAVSATSDLYVQRINDIVDDCIRWGVLEDTENKQSLDVNSEATMDENNSPEEHLLNFLKKIAKKQKFNQFETKITPVSTKGANYTSNLFKIKVTGESRELDLFAKVSVMDVNVRQQVQFNPFTVEKFFYTDLMKTYGKIEEVNGVSENDKLKFAKYYGTETSHLREILILEDLTSRGFVSANRFVSIDWPYASAAITELAKLHALSMAFENQNPQEFEKILTNIPGGLFESTDLFTPFFNAGAKSALAAVREEHRDHLQNFVQKHDLVSYFNKLQKPLNRKVIVHSDFRPNNMLHKVLNDTTTEVIPVDYQTVQPGSPVVDLIYFIFTGTDGAFRAKYYEKSIEHYYSELSVALARLGLNVEHQFSREKFDSELKEKLPYGLVLTLAFLPSLVVPEDKAPELGADLSSMIVTDFNDIYRQRLNEAIDDFVKMGVLGDTRNSTKISIPKNMPEEEHLLTIVKKIATEQKFNTFETKITPVSTHGANYSSTLFKIKITGEGRDLDLFAKVAAIDGKVREQAQMNPFDNETWFYTDLAATYLKLEEKQNVSDKNRLRVPKYYGADKTYLRETLVLEDLTSKGFGSANRFKSVEGPYATAAITELAKFHALSLAYEQENPGALDNFAKKHPSVYENFAGVEPLFANGMKTALGAVRKKNKRKLEEYLQTPNVMEHFTGAYKSKHCKVITHTDFRPSNMLHKVVNNQTEVVPVDYQTLQVGTPVTDLIYFIFTATDGPFRAKYYTKLINHYYLELGMAMKRLGLNIAKLYPRKDFDTDLEEKLPYGLILMVMFLPLLLVPEDQVPVMDNIDSLAVSNTSDLYARRLNEAVDDYVAWGYLGKKSNSCFGRL